MKGRSENRSVPRKSCFVDPRAIGRARQALGTATDAETGRLAVERVVEMEKF